MTLLEPFNYEGHYASMVQREALRLAQLGFGDRFKTYRSTPMAQVQPSDLPVLGIYILKERSTPFGDANHAAPKFVNEITIGLSGAIHAETADQNHLYQLEEWMVELDNILLCDAEFARRVGAVEGMNRVSQYAKVGETTLFEIRNEMVFCIYREFPPRVDDWLDKVHVKTQYPDKEHADSGTPQLEQEYDLGSQS
jgi:hypothetical protein